jgi:hypothetical protein
MTERSTAHEEKTMQGEDKAPDAMPDPARRSFLKAAPLGALAALTAGAQAETALPPVEAAKPAAKRGYHETEHIRRYYQTAAYW